MSESKELDQRIREIWFKDHIAKYTKINGRISILDWGKPGTIYYYVRYVFDGYWLYISGDLDEAVFEFSSKINHPSNFTDTGLGYFHSKLSAFHGPKWDFDGEKAAKRLFEEYKELRRECGVSKEKLEFFRKMIGLANSCLDVNEWAQEFNAWYYNELSEVDQDCWEWIYNIGNDYPSRTRAYLIGLKMAAEQLGDDEG